MSEKMRKYIINIFLGIIALGIVMPSVITIFYTLPNTDDFSVACVIDKNQLFITALERANENYLNWSGGWPCIFLQGLLNPIVLFGATSRLIGVELIFYFAIFVFSIYCAVRAVFKMFKDSRMDILLMSYCVLLWMILNADVYTEIFYWYIGSTYMLWLAFSLFLVAIIIRYMTNRFDKRTGVLLSFVGFTTCMSYQHAVFPGIVYIVLWIWKCFEQKRIMPKRLIPFGFMLLGGVLSAFAPGNFARHSSFGEGFNIPNAIMDAVDLAIRVVKRLFLNPAVVVGFVICVIIGIIIFEKSTYLFKYPIIPCLITGICTFFVCFPTALGYGSSGFPNRQFFMANTYTILGLFICALYFGGYIVKKIDVCITKKDVWQMGAVAFLFAYAVLIANYQFESTPWYQMISSVGEIKVVTEEWSAVYEEIENSKEKDVIIKLSDKLQVLPIIKSPAISEDETSWINAAVARYYGKNSVKVEWVNSEED